MIEWLKICKDKVDSVEQTWNKKLEDYEDQLECEDKDCMEIAP